MNHSQHLKIGWVYLDRVGNKHQIVTSEIVNGEELFTDEQGLIFRSNGKFVGDIISLCRDKSNQDLTEELYECHGLDTVDQVCFYEQDFYVLSNFSSFQIEFDERVFPTSEHLYHWRRFFLSPKEGSSEVASEVYNARSAHDAFKIAQANKHFQVDMWDDIKVHEMEKILRLKVEQHDYVKRKLLTTGDRLLIENSWRDSEWGTGSDGKGKNLLGKLWMKIRSDLQNQVVPYG